MPERNPYLILGVDFAASGGEARRAFAHAARRLRREGGVWEVADLNWALHEVEALEENPADSVDVYRVPADLDVFEPVGYGLFRPEPAALGRRTPSRDSESLQQVRRAALHELDELMLEDLGQMPMPSNAYELEEIT
jgi:hypothetical protein